MPWFDEWRLGWTRDTGDKPPTWTLEQLKEWFASADESLQAEFEVELVPFPAHRLTGLTQGNLREVTGIFEKEEQWTYIWIGVGNEALVEQGVQRIEGGTD